MILRQFEALSQGFDKHIKAPEFKDVVKGFDVPKPHFSSVVTGATRPAIEFDLTTKTGFYEDEKVNDGFVSGSGVILATEFDSMCKNTSDNAYGDFVVDVGDSVHSVSFFLAPYLSFAFFLCVILLCCVCLFAFVFCCIVM